MRYGRRLLVGAIAMACAAAGLWASPATAQDTDADLNVTHIERTPKYDYDAPKNMPEPGDEVTFWGHIRYWGGEGSRALDEVTYEWRIDGETVASGTLEDFEPLLPPFPFDYWGYPDPTDAEAIRDESSWPKDPARYDPGSPPTGLRVVSLPWTWQDGRHTVELIVDPGDEITERTEANNSVRDYTDALAAGFWIEESLWRYFHENQWRLDGAGSNSWADWIQRQMAKQNELYETAVYPEITPEGIDTRVRIDRLIVVPDGMLPLNGGLPSNNPDSSDKTVDLQWGFASSMLDGDFYARVDEVSDDNPFYLEKSLIHELGHARYLIDSYGFNVHDQDPEDRVIQVYEDGEWIVGPYLEWVRPDDMVYENKYGGVMTGPYGFVWGPYEAAMLQRIAGERAREGNMNSPGNIGEYLNELPENNYIRFLDPDGEPREDVSMQIFRATGKDEVWYGKVYDGEPDAELQSGEDGWIDVGRNPFTGGPPISHTFGIADGVMLVRLEQEEQVWYRFIECTEFNLEYYKGNTEEAYYEFVLE